MYRLYTDGSYNSMLTIASWAFILIDEKDNIVCKKRGICKNHEMWQVEGELEGVIWGLRAVYKLGIKEITVCYDMKGVENWAEKKWKAKQKGTKEYVQIIDSARKFIKIHWKKIDAHTGEKYNEAVDKLAHLDNLPNELFKGQVI